MNFSRTKMFFTADSHFFHSKILKYCARPFVSVEQMNATMIENWNRVVPTDGVIIHLGDFGLAPKDILRDTLEKLKGYKILLLGNHDKSITSMSEIGFQEIHKYVDFKKDGLKIFMSHVPMNSKYHDVNLSGHVHNTFVTNGNILNCGVDVQNFTPISWGEVIVYHSKMLGYKSIKEMEIIVDGEC